MKRLMRTGICLLLSFICLIPVLSVSAQTASDESPVSSAQESRNIYYNDDFYYEITDDNTVTILLYKSEKTTLTIPSKINAFPVTAIEKWAFSNTPVQSITISEGITSISDEAFYNASDLTSVVLPESLEEVGMGLFRNCTNLKRVTYRGDKSILGPYMYYGCVSLININLKDNTTEIPVGAFAYCRRLNVIALPKMLQKINDYAFYNTALTSLVLPESVSYIGNLSFAENSSLTYISARNSKCDYVHEDAFIGCPADDPFRIVPTEPIPPTTDINGESPSDFITVYFTNNKNWENVYIYGFYGVEGGEAVGEPLGGYPGTEMTFVDTNEYGEDIYRATVPADIDYIKFCEDTPDNNRTFNIPNSELSHNIGFYLTNNTVNNKWEYGTHEIAGDPGPSDPPVYEEEITIYFTADSDWKDVYIYGFYGEENKPVATEWPDAYPGAKMTYVRTNEYGEKVYSYKIPGDIDYIKFSDGSPYNRRTVNIPNSDLHNNIGFRLTNVLTSNKWDVSTYIYSPKDVIPDYYTIYFTANPDWEGAYLYGFNGAENTTPESIYPCEYPGMEMTFVEVNKYGQNIYSCKVPSDIDYIKFSDGSPSNRRTVNIPNSELRQNVGFYLKSGAGTNKWSVSTYVYMDGETTTPDITLPTYGDPVPPVSASNPSDIITPTPNRVYIIGDADSNYIVNIDDVTLILQYTDHYAEIPEELLDAADADRNGRITKDDAIAIQNYICGTLTDSLINTPCNPDNPMPEVQTPETENNAPRLKAPDVGIAAGNDLIIAAKGSTVTYRVSLTSEEAIRDIQATIRYDSTKLKLVRINSDEEYFSSTRMEEALCFPNLLDVVYSADTENEIRFNSSSSNGYGFYQGETLAEFEFEVVDPSAYSEIKIDIQYMSDISGNHYFYSSKPVNEGAVSVSETVFGSDTLKPDYDFFVENTYYFSPNNSYLTYESQHAQNSKGEQDDNATTIEQNACEFIAGDVNGDGRVNARDATLILKVIADIPFKDSFDSKMADINADGSMNVRDATEIQKFLAGLPSILDKYK